ncbi:MAG: AMP-binding protein [Eubacteriales bacterium]|nr:AMP-binding protein [Eubacteriales bacterium]
MDHKEYEKIKAKEWDYAVARIEGIKASKDPFILYRDGRPIIDVKHMMSTSAEIYGNRPAFHVKDAAAGQYVPISYKEAKADMDALGTALIDMGLKGERIGIIGDNCYEWAIAYLASLCGTGIVVPLDKELPAVELENLVKEADVRAIFYTSKFEQTFLNMKQSTKLSFFINMNKEEDQDGILSFKKTVEKGKTLLAGGNHGFVDAIIERDTMSVILFTSGTTGISKGVMLSHGNLVEDIMASPTLLRVNPEDIFFSVLPIHHTYECTCGFLVPLYCGASIAYCEGLKHILKNLQEVKPTMFLCVPLIMENIYKKIWSTARKSGMEKKLRILLKINRFTRKVGIDLVPQKIKDVFGGRMRIMIVGGAAIDPEILRGIQDIGISALQGYGLTECAPICALNPDKAAKDSSAGYIPPGFDIKIVDADPETGIGEICAKGGNVMLGYYNNEENTNEVLKDGWFHTGDLGYLDKDRFVYITGRKKNVIITKNGKNVFPEEIEYYLGKIPYVAECLVWGKDSQETGETLIFASIKVDEEEVKESLGGEYTDQQVFDLLWTEIDKLNDELPLFKRIKKIAIRKTEFEKTTGKKIKRFVEENKTITE